MLRLELDGLTPAAGNPFIGVAGARPEVYAFGLRNPFRMSFDPQTGRLWAGDVGQSTIEEIDIIQSGGNYAWPHCEGTLPAGCQATATPGPVIDPVLEYTHSGAGGLGNSVTGGAFATESFGQLGGQYFFGDFTASKLFVAVPNAARDDIGTPVGVRDGRGRPGGHRLRPRRSALLGGDQRRAGAPGRAGLRATGGRDADARLARAGIPGVRLPEPHARPAARVRLLQPAGGALRAAHGRHPRRERPGRGLDRASCASPFRSVTPPPPPTSPTSSLRLEITDVRRRSDLADYTGEVRASVPTRITDKDNPRLRGWRVRCGR